MTWVIAILLALILVAMVSSNQAAATGVWMVVRFVLWAIAALVGWGILIGYAWWFYEAYPPSPEWSGTVGVALAVILPPIFLWATRKKIAATYNKDKWAAARSGAIVIGWILAWMVIGPIVQEVKRAYEYGLWAMVLVPLAGTGAILLWRSTTGSKSWREVWLGPPDLPDPWLVMSAERDAVREAESVAYDEMQSKQGELAKEEYEMLMVQRNARLAATADRLEALEKKLEAEQMIRSREQQGLKVNHIFWLFLVFAGLGLIGVAWEVGFDYAMELKFVKGRAWMAGGAVIFAGVVVVGAVGSILDEIQESRRQKAAKKIGGIEAKSGVQTGVQSDFGSS